MKSMVTSSAAPVRGGGTAAGRSGGVAVDQARRSRRSVASAPRRGVSPAIASRGESGRSRIECAAPSSSMSDRASDARKSLPAIDARCLRDCRRTVEVARHRPARSDGWRRTAIAQRSRRVSPCHAALQNPDPCAEVAARMRDWQAACAIDRAHPTVWRGRHLPLPGRIHRASNRAFTTLPPCVSRTASPISSSSTGSPASLSQNADRKLNRLRLNSARCVRRQARGHVAVADDLHAVDLDDLARHRALDVAAGLDRQVDDHAAGAHRRDLRVADQPRGGAAGDQRGGDDDVLLGDVRRDERGLRGLVLVGHLGRVAARSLRPRCPSRPRRRSAWRRATGSAPWSPSARRWRRPARPAAARWRSPASPATPTPITNTLAALTVPAAVIIIGKARPYSPAASSTAL